MAHVFIVLSPPPSSSLSSPSIPLLSSSSPPLLLHPSSSTSPPRPFSSPLLPPLPPLLPSSPQIAAESQSIAFELEEVKTGPNAEPFLVELLHQAAYRNNTIGLPCICPEENLNKITTAELKEFLAAHYVPSRVVLTGVNVDHQQLVELAREHFVDPRTSWEGVATRGIDESISQYASYDVKVCNY